MKNIKTILIISESINIEDSSGSKVNVALITNLHKIGYVVKVLHYTRKEIQLENIECINIKEINYSVNYFLSRTQRVLQRLFKIDLSHFLENIFGHSFTFFNDSKSILKSIEKHYEGEDLVLTLSKGASFRPHHAMLKLPTIHNKWMAYVHDPYPFHYYPRPYNWVEKGYKYKEKFFREVSNKAAYSGFPSLLLKEWVGSYFPNFLQTGLIIPHQDIEILTTNDIAFPDYFNENYFTILHAGNLMTERDPKGLIEGFHLFLKNNPLAKEETSLLLLGVSNAHREIIIQYEKEIKQLFFSDGNIPFNIVKNIQNKVSVNVILEAKSEISPFLPAKFTHCVKANKPILLLGPFYSETRRLLKEDYLYASEIDNIEKIASAIEKLYLIWKEAPTNLKLNRTDLNNYVGLKHLKQKMESILN